MISGSPAIAPDGGFPRAARRDENLVILSSLAANLLALALPVMTLQIYDRILPNPDSGTLPVLMTGVSVAVLAEAALKIARAWMIGWNGAVYEYHAVSAAMRHLLRTDAAKIRARDSGTHLHRMAAVGKTKDFHDGHALSVLIDLLFVLVYAGFMVYIAGALSVAPLALLAGFALVSLAGGIKLRHRMQMREETDDKRYNFLIECLNRIHAIKALALENGLCRRYEALQESSVAANYGVAEATASVFNTGTVMAHAMAAVTITVGAPLVLNGRASTGALIAVLLLAGRMMQAVQKGLVLWVKYQDHRLSHERVGKIFAMPLVEYAERLPRRPPEGRLSVRAASFALEGVSLLQDLSLDVKPGDVVALGGSDAAGRTALLNLISGAWPVQAGEIGIDGAGIAHYRPEDLTRHVGHITAEPVIFRGTIRDNITRFGEIGEKSARAVASFLGVDKDVAGLPGGFDTVLYGNSNDTVPPGLKQRIAMTRVLAAGPRIVLFDEADRFLDRDGHKRVVRLLAELRKTCAIIIVTEDPDMRALANRRCVLSDGMLKEEG